MKVDRLTPILWVDDVDAVHKRCLEQGIEETA